MEELMLDLVFVLLGVALFAVAAGYVEFCGKF